MLHITEAWQRIGIIYRIILLIDKETILATHKGRFYGCIISGSCFATYVLVDGT